MAAASGIGREEKVDERLANTIHYSPATFHCQRTRRPFISCAVLIGTISVANNTLIQDRPRYQVGGRGSDVHSIDERKRTHESDAFERLFQLWIAGDVSFAGNDMKRLAPRDFGNTGHQGDIDFGRL